MRLQMGAFAAQDERPLDEGVIGGAFEVLEKMGVGAFWGHVVCLLLVIRI